MKTFKREPIEEMEWEVGRITPVVLGVFLMFVMVWVIVYFISQSYALVHNDVIKEVKERCETMLEY